MTAATLIQLARAKYAECLMDLGVPEGSFYGADYQEPAGFFMGAVAPMSGYMSIESPWRNPHQETIRQSLETFKRNAIANCGWLRPPPEPVACSPSQWSYLRSQGYIEANGDLTDKGKKIMSETISKCLNAAAERSEREDQEN